MATRGFFGGESRSHPRLVKKRQLKVNKDQNGKRELFLYPCCLKYKLRLIVMSTNLEYRKRESRRQASEAQPEKERQRARARTGGPDVVCVNNMDKMG